MATLQLKGMNDRLYEALRARAAARRRSISREAVALIEEGLSRSATDPEAATRTFLAELAGKWADDRPPEEIAKEMRKARHFRKRLGDNGDVFA